MAQTTIAPSGAILTELFSASTRSEVYAKMDDRLRSLQAEGHQLTNRRPVGRNSPCPCQSGLKFKKCCIGRTL